ncbi:MAG: aldo/keto reductase [SAR202 cluster bacterium]|nr:hypothetical protein [Chloroflexota bacterium]MQG88226.1 aldo/keto reductase [SAR202 cluster bacterium]|tara:strand:- start:199 stop:1170 length:972 start_codon:yes stop_codon:yes gene_type:complete
MTILKTHRLGKSEIHATMLGLGGGHLDGHEQTDEEAVTLIRGAIERGINFVDTSAGYGRSEERYGMALSDGWRDKVHLQTKVGSHPKVLRNWSRKATTWSLENSFRRLRTEYVDSVLIHGPRFDIEEPLDHCLDVMLEWKEKGRIGAVGVGVRQPEFHMKAIDKGVDIILSFLNYTLLDQTLAKESIPYAIQHDVGILIGSPIADGLLAGHEPKHAISNYQQNTTTEGILDQNGRVIPAAVGSFRDPNAYPKAHQMWKWCQDRNVNIRHLAMQFAINAPVQGKGIVLTGAANLAQLEDSLHIATSPIDENIWSEFESTFGIRA